MGPASINPISISKVESVRQVKDLPATFGEYHWPGRSGTGFRFPADTQEDFFSGPGINHLSFRDSPHNASHCHGDCRKVHCGFLRKSLGMQLVSTHEDMRVPADEKADPVDGGSAELSGCGIWGFHPAVLVGVVLPQALMFLVLSFILYKFLMFRGPDVVRARTALELPVAHRHAWPWLERFRFVLPLMKYPCVAWACYGLYTALRGRQDIWVPRSTVIAVGLASSWVALAVLYGALSFE